MVVRADRLAVEGTRELDQEVVEARPTTEHAESGHCLGHAWTGSSLLAFTTL